LWVFFTVTLPVVTPADPLGRPGRFLPLHRELRVPVLIGEDFRVLSVQAYNDSSARWGEPRDGGDPEHDPSGRHAGAHPFPEVLGRAEKLRPWTSLNPLESKRLGPLPTLLICSSAPGGLRRLFPFVVVMVSSVTKTQGPVMSSAGGASITSSGLHGRPPGRSSTPSSSRRTATLIGIVFGIAVSYLLVRRRGAVRLSPGHPGHAPPGHRRDGPGDRAGSRLQQGFIVLTGTWMILVLAYFIRKAPYSIKTTLVVPRADRPSIGRHRSTSASPGPSFHPGGHPRHGPGIIAGASSCGVRPCGAQLDDRPVLRPLGHDDREVFQRIGSGDFDPPLPTRRS